MISLGITGTHKGATPEQERELRRIMTSMDISEVHHGDCIGVDALGHEIALSLRDTGDEMPLSTPSIIIHPPENGSKRAFCESADIILPAKPYLERDMDIAKASDVLIAVPDGYHELVRSGTWTTVRYARGFNKRLVIVIFPDGTVEI
jgi:hypothetical protein